MPIGTARMASLCLPAAELHVGMRWGGSAALARALGDTERPPILLYPGAGARDILQEPPSGPVTLVVVDGTWSQAKTVVRDNPVLQALPRYAFCTPEPSQYRIRREPDEAYVSTIEALMHVLGVLEGDSAKFRRLLDPLNAMVEAQLACQAKSPRRRERHVKVKVAPSQRLPVEICERFGDLVCVVGEANAWPYRAGVESPREELVHWVAERVATGERFDVIAAPESALSPSTPFHSELAEGELLGGGSREVLYSAIESFTRPTDVWCSWGRYGVDLLRDGGGPVAGEWMDLRGHAHRMTNRKLGSLEGYAASLEGGEAQIARGRGGRRLAMLVKIVRAWRALATATG